MPKLKKYSIKDRLEAGVDEAGRGCLAGPVVAAAVILPKNAKLPGLNDSKKLSAAKRETLRVQIEQQALSWAVSFVDAQTIDQINILQASFLAMHNAIDQLLVTPECLLIDGNRFKDHSISHECHVKGDGKYLSIAAASILAKTHRDRYMMKLAKGYPHYDWLNNKGYPTKKHRQAIQIHGDTPFHRKTFRLSTEDVSIE